MRITLITVGDRTIDWVETACNEYLKRLVNHFQLEHVQIPLAKRTKNSDPKKVIADESRRLLDAVPANDYVIALDLSGEQYSTEKLAQKISQWKMERYNLSFLVGGPDGFSNICLQRAQTVMALSRLTLPHPLVKIIFYEQLYRSWAIINNHPYHK